MEILWERSLFGLGMSDIFAKSISLVKGVPLHDIVRGRLGLGPGKGQNVYNKWRRSCLGLVQKCS